MTTETKKAREELKALQERYNNLAREHNEVTARLNEASKRAGAARLDGDDAASGIAKAEMTELQSEARALQEAMAELHRRTLPVQASAWLEEADEILARVEELNQRKREYKAAVDAALAELERVSQRRWKPETSGNLWVDRTEKLREKARSLRRQATQLQREIEAA